MSLSRDTMMELMAYADGELEGEALAKTEALVQSNEEARRIVEAMTGVGDFVRQAADEAPHADLSQADTIADVVMRKVNAEPTAKLRRPTSIPPRERRGRAAVAVVAVLALAAGAMLLLRRDEPRPEQALQQVERVESPAPSGAPPEMAPSPSAVAQASPASSGTTAQPDTSGVDVEQVESPSHQVSVFYLPAVAAAAANKNASSVVVWIGDDNGGH
jgi:hypothetical protein